MKPAEERAAEKDFAMEAVLDAVNRCQQHGVAPGIIIASLLYGAASVAHVYGGGDAAGAAFSHMAELAWSRLTNALAVAAENPEPPAAG